MQLLFATHAIGSSGVVSTSRSCGTKDGNVFGGIEFGLRDITDCDEESLSCCIDDFAIFTFGVDGGFKSPRLVCFSVSVAKRSVGAFV
ncbi:MAG: hypothetical protein OSA23_12830 [Rhodospirillales bacterium]|nr:hypothetical protein [Rhodospirillales bacterium]